MFDKTHLRKICLEDCHTSCLSCSSPCLPLQTFHTPSLGDEEFEIPPITPPPETESGLGLSDVDSPFPAMQEPPVPHRGPIIPQFPPQSLDLPSITISRNMMEQEGMSINNGQPVVSTAMHSHPKQIKRLRYLLPVCHPTLLSICQFRSRLWRDPNRRDRFAFKPIDGSKSYTIVAEITLPVSVSRSRYTGNSKAAAEND